MIGSIAVRGCEVAERQGSGQRLANRGIPKINRAAAVERAPDLVPIAPVRVTLGVRREPRARLEREGQRAFVIGPVGRIAAGRSDRRSRPRVAEAVAIARCEHGVAAATAAMKAGVEDVRLP